MGGGETREIRMPFAPGVGEQVPRDSVGQDEHGRVDIERRKGQRTAFAKGWEISAAGKAARGAS